MAPFLAEIANF